MKLVNITKNSVIAVDIRETNGVINRSKGLLGTSTPQAIILHTRFGIHTFGMRYPLDILILDSTMKVVKVKKNLQPNNIFMWNIRYSTIIELPVENILNSKTAINDTLKLEPIV